MGGLALYNEWERYPAAWLRNLIAAGHIAPGRVDERSIAELTATDLVGVVQFHAFAGIGCWSCALRLAGWSDDDPVWTVSCPCQPFSPAGRRKGTSDDRHLWPVYFELVRECRPPVVLGEQVAGPDGLRWFDAVHADLERAGYAVGAAVTTAAGVGAPHIRERLYFVGVANAEELGRGPGRDNRSGGRAQVEPRGHGAGGRLGDADREHAGRDGGAGARAEAPSDRERLEHGRGGDEPRASGRARIFGAWDDAICIPCTDGKSRPVGAGLRPLVDGPAPGVGRVRTARVPRLKGYGNGLCVPQAAAFSRAAKEVIDERRSA